MFLEKFTSKLSNKEKIGLTFALSFLFIVFVYRLIIDPINKRFQKINREIQINEKRLGLDLRNLKQKDFITEEYEKYVQYVKSSGSDEEEVAKILGEIESLARKSKVQLVDIKSMTPKKVDFYKEYIVNIEAEGEMEALIKFLQQLNTSSQLLRAEKLRISLKRRGDSTIKASLMITKVLIL
jgi:Tfp pilus assembly protein PilO